MKEDKSEVLNWSDDLSIPARLEVRFAIQYNLKK